MAGLFPGLGMQQPKRTRREAGDEDFDMEDGCASSNGGWKGVLSQEQVSDLAVRTAQLVSIHDIRLRELAALVPQIRVPLTSAYGRGLHKCDAEWKGILDAYNRKKATGEDTPNIGSKHLRLGATLLGMLTEDVGTKAEIRVKLQGRWTEEDRKKPHFDFLAADVLIAKWRPGRDNKTGVLEFKLGSDMQDVEQEVVNRLVDGGGTVLAGIAPKGARARELDAALQRTWNVGR